MAETSGNASLPVSAGSSNVNTEKSVRNQTACDVCRSRKIRVRELTSEHVFASPDPVDANDVSPVHLRP